MKKTILHTSLTRKMAFLNKVYWREEEEGGGGGGRMKGRNILIFATLYHVIA